MSHFIPLPYEVGINRSFIILKTTSKQNNSHHFQTSYTDPRVQETAVFVRVAGGLSLLQLLILFHLRPQTPSHSIPTLAIVLMESLL